MESIDSVFCYVFTGRATWPFGTSLGQISHLPVILSHQTSSQSALDFAANRVQCRFNSQAADSAREGRYGTATKTIQSRRSVVVGRAAVAAGPGTISAPNSTGAAVNPQHPRPPATAHCWRDHRSAGAP